MSQATIRSILRTTGSAADADLLAQFAATQDESSFELLVWRHMALVQRVCRAVLRDHHAAEDAAQATFLVLARKANTFAGRGPVVGWLYRIARRIAVRMAKERGRRTATQAELERLPDARAESSATPDEVAALCTEVDRLPERYRVPVLLCFFEGLTHADAARRTGWPVGTVAGRLARAKELLARRLSKKGVGVATVVLAVPAGSFVGGTAQAAVAFAVRPVGGAVVPGVEPSVIRLAEGTLKTMTTFTWKLTAATAAALCAVSVVTATVIGGGAAPVATAPPATPAATAAPVPPPKKDTGERIADAKQRVRSQNNLKQILLAIHNYTDANNHFPRNIVDKNGKPLLSWRVELLPYIEQDNLYKQFKMDEPWDSANNKKLLAQMPDILRVGFEPKDETKTYYQGFAGPGTIFDPEKKLTFVSVTDGTSNTLAVVEAGSPVEWTRPMDLPYDPKKPLPKLEGPFANTMLVATADGGTHAFRRDLDEKILRRLIEIADGEIVSTDDARTKFPLNADDLKMIEKLAQENEKLIADVSTQLKEQQKLLLELLKRPGANDADLARLAETNSGLKDALEKLKKDAAELKNGREEAPPFPTPTKSAPKK